MSPAQHHSLNTTGACDAVKLDDVSSSLRLAESIARVATVGDVIGLMGPIGIGKTVFARGFIRSLTHHDEIVPSPTYTLMQVYETGAIPIYHYDLYRIQSNSELEELGLDAAVAGGIILIEWPESIGALGGVSRLNMSFEAGKEGPSNIRIISFDPGLAWQKRLNNAVKAFVEETDA
tara:strand:- start:237 stop:767 length:531 start_codon:yes stop_codon:yes gene_type:complete